MLSPASVLYHCISCGVFDSGILLINIVNSLHTSGIDVQLNVIHRIITGILKSTSISWLPSCTICYHHTFGVRRKHTVLYKGPDDSWWCNSPESRLKNILGVQKLYREHRPTQMLSRVGIRCGARLKQTLLNVIR